ncbi:MAG: B12-binding domain-containing radical SAM protein [Nitrospirae bacterium]|nr:B12-binding domain-containing radical SAM protein [Nitrospirota bacterium]
MKVLLVYPKYPDTFWSFKHAIKFISKKASVPPLGMLTVASMLPKDWQKRLIDMNVRELEDKDLKWADIVFLSAMSVQKKSVREVIDRCKILGVKVAAGGPYFTSCHEDFPDVDHLVLNEAEVTLAPFIEDLKNGCAKRMYTAGNKWADVKETPAPDWSILEMKKYATVNIQYSRGCPFNCEFCDITMLYGHAPRTKTKEQVVAELEAIYSHGWRGGVFFVDDNFIGNKKKLKEEILPAIIEWMEKRRYPFSFLTQVSINISDDEELMTLMAKAGFDTVFIGIETPNEDSLAECSKAQNKKRDLIGSVKKIQQFGFEVQGGFIVGFDNDPPSIFQSQIKFIQESGIVTAMVGLLNALRGTKLYHRLKEENRLVKDVTGDNTDCSINFIPKMHKETLVSGYKKILEGLYSPKQYYARVRTFLREYQPLQQKRAFHFKFMHLQAFFKSTVILGVIGKERFQYWKLLIWTILRRPNLFPLSITLAIYGFHFRKVFESHWEES